MRIFSCWIAAVLLAAAPGWAQEATSRADEESRRQAAKAKTVHPEPLNFFKRQLLDIEQGGGFGAPRGFMAVFGGIKKGSGFAPGVAYSKLFNNEGIAQAKVVYSIRNYKLAQVSYQLPPLAERRLRVSTRVRWQDAPAVAFYELGTTPSTQRADYAETKSEVSAAATFRPLRVLHLEGSVGFERFDTGPGDSAKPPIPSVFPDLVVPGLNADPDYLHTLASAELDSRDGEGFSRHGTLLRAALHDYRQQNTGPYSFQRLDGAAEQYIPILHGNWVIYAGLRASTTTAADGNEVPFFLMPDIGGSDLRGYGNYRFRDRHSLVFTAEYRWYAQEFLEAALFYDAGKAVARRSDLDFSGLKSNVGFGVRFHGPQTTAIRMEIARGSEGLRFIMAFSPVGGS